MFITANEKLFIPGTLRPTDYRVRGLDRKLHRADAIGYAQLHFHDQNNTIWRITVQGLLVKKVMPNSFTLVSVPQLNLDGISLNQPCLGRDPTIACGRALPAAHRFEGRLPRVARHPLLHEQLVHSRNALLEHDALTLDVLPQVVDLA